MKTCISIADDFNRPLFIFILILFSYLTINAQSVDSVKVIQDSSLLNTPSVSLSKKSKKDSVFTPIPKKALLYSIIPGGGQIYNRKLWYVRLPLVYGAMGGTGYWTYFNVQRHKLLKEAYFNKVNGKDLPSGVPASLSAERLKQLRDSYYKRVQQAYVLTSITYILSAAEAFTTAHLLNFDVSEDISFRFKPDFQTVPYGNVAGIGISMTF